jgi:hypothetical protein
VILYSVSHLRPRGDHRSWPLVDVKHIGLFASESAARRAIRDLRLAPGFRRFHHQFRIEHVEVDTDLYPDGFEQHADFALIPDS